MFSLWSAFRVSSDAAEGCAVEDTALFSLAIKLLKEDSVGFLYEMFDSVINKIFVECCLIRQAIVGVRLHGIYLVRGKITIQVDVSKDIRCLVAGGSCAAAAAIW